VGQKAEGWKRHTTLASTNAIARRGPPSPSPRPIATARPMTVAE